MISLEAFGFSRGKGANGIKMLVFYLINQSKDNGRYCPCLVMQKAKIHNFAFSTFKEASDLI